MIWFVFDAKEQITPSRDRTGIRAPTARFGAEFLDPGTKSQPPVWMVGRLLKQNLESELRRDLNLTHGVCGPDRSCRVSNQPKGWCRGCTAASPRHIRAAGCTPDCQGIRRSRNTSLSHPRLGWRLLNGGTEASEVQRAMVRYF